MFVSSGCPVVFFFFFFKVFFFFAVHGGLMCLCRSKRRGVAAAAAEEHSGLSSAIDPCLVLFGLGQAERLQRRHSLFLSDTGSLAPAPTHRSSPSALCFPTLLQGVLYRRVAPKPSGRLVLALPGSVPFPPACSLLQITHCRST